MLKIAMASARGNLWKPTEPRGRITLRPFTTMVDWLSVTCSGPFWAVRMPVGEWAPWEGLNMRPGAMLKAMDPPREWGKRFYLMDAVGGDKLATILAAPENRQRHQPDYMVVQFANQTLATGEWREIAASLWAMGCTYIGVQRLDIAADGWMGEVIGGGTEEADISSGAWSGERIGQGGDYLAVVQAALAGYGRYYGKARWGTEHLGNQWNGFSFGTRAANKFLRCYRKKREMKSKGHKPHIAAAWSAALGGYDAMTDPREVGRLEVVLKGKELRRYYTGEGDFEKLAMLHDPVLRAGVFEGAVSTIFDFRTWPTDGRARSAQPMHEWDWSVACYAPPPKMTREKRRIGVGIERVKLALHYLHDLAYITADPEVMRIAERTAAAAGDGMVDYFRRKCQVWSAECARVMHTVPVMRQDTIETEDGPLAVEIRTGISAVNWSAEDDRARFMRSMFVNLGAVEPARSDGRMAAFFARHGHIANAVDPDAADDPDDLSDYL